MSGQLLDWHTLEIYKTSIALHFAIVTVQCFVGMSMVDEQFDAQRSL